jgi:hypothetical protein
MSMFTINANLKSPLLYPRSVDISIEYSRGLCATVGGLFETWLYGVGTQLLSRMVGVRQGLVDHESNAK